ncbi:hypothetical protein [Chitinophaga qingshengii]|uniref:DUF5017 domain-containing protein n=1 Tax=Chitinophaga qingshengii TaxID=1569794 RepID=A0ABR7TLV1_9BACT|nr:hypothetical protein [Chitinophaga qingshengii]MBC9930948.1 hypothetical protein [Chitinophaga qingshengii]
MKKLILIGAALTLTIFACSKKDDNSNPPPDPITKPYNASSLTAASVASRGTIVKGALPAASATADAPVLSATIAADTYSAVAGRYLVIPVPVEQGSIVKGAYVQFEGADAYFNIDFSKPAGGRIANQRSIFGRDIYGNFNDSAVIIKVPADVSNGVVKLLISVYNAAGKISKSVTVSANLFNTAASTDSKALSGKWKMSRLNEADGKWINPYVADSSRSFYVCNNGTLAFASDPTAPGAVNLVQSYWKTIEEYMELNANGSAKSVYFDSSYQLNLSSCNSRSYNGYADRGSEDLSWYYDGTAKKIYIISDIIKQSTKDFYLVIADVKLENGKLIVTEEDGYATEYTKE